jgi:hypothetical protein
MSTEFPAIRPTEREFTLGTFPTKSYRALSGATVKRSFGNKPYGYQLMLVFSNIPDDITNQLLQHYEATLAGFNRFKIPNRVFSGMTNEVQSRIQSPYNIRWEYASPPTVQSLYRRISTVTINLIGEINV